MVKKAFLIGINDYAPAGQSELDLNGCINDVRDMANTLIICGFPSSNIRLCTDKRATKAGILKGLNWLISNAKDGDSLVFYYSGHGSQVADISGDEVDRKDEILCPHDIDFETSVYISDDDLQTIISKLPAGVNLEIILDSCHSGTGTRDLISPEENKSKIRYMPPPIDFTFHIDYNPDIRTKRLLGERGTVIVQGLNHTLWAACRDNQTSEECKIDSVIRGVFTYHFCQVLRRTNGNIKRKELLSIVTAAIKRGGFVQIPQLETSTNETLDKPFC